MKEADIGLVITKSPFEGSLVEGALQMAKDAVAHGHTVGIFLISDGVLLVKRGQKGRSAELFRELLNSDSATAASRDHLDATGISPGEMLERVAISEKPYDDLVENVMERWGKVVSI